MGSNPTRASKLLTMAVDLLENCETCYPFTLSEFPSPIVIKGGLNHALQYYFKFTDKFQNSFITLLITPDANGIVTITIPASFPAAWFNKDAGRFYIEASLTTDIWTPVNFTFSVVTYGCIVVEFVNDNSGKNTIL